jgi:hypothetical protein
MHIVLVRVQELTNMKLCFLGSVEYKYKYK